MITPSPLADARLLQHFVLNGDEAAFAELVRRHEGLVQGVCRRVLGPGGDIEDAAQSTFLSLARNAPTLVERMHRDASLAGWIYRVAVNTALQQRRASRSRCRREATVVRERSVPRDETTRAVEDREVLSILDEELTRLPSRFRTPLVLCHLEGKTQQEAASELGLSYGTLRRRLDHARRLLRARLDRRGVVVSTAILAWLAKNDAARAGQSVSYVKSRAATGPGGGSSTTVWTCIGQPISLMTSQWLLAAVLAGMVLPPAISVLMSGALATGSKPEPAPPQRAESAASPGMLAAAR